MKKTLSIILTLAMILSMFSVSVFATEEVVEETPVNVAKIDDQTFTSLQEAVDAAEVEDTIKLVSNVELDETLVVRDEDEITLDLAGYTVSMTDSSGRGSCLLKNSGILTIMDSSRNKAGKLTYLSTTPDSVNFSYSTSTVINIGSITVESGTIENTTSAGASYAIDNGWYSKDVSLTFNGGKALAVKTAVRQVLFTENYKNKVTVNKGATIEGDSAGLQLHSYSTGNQYAEIDIKGGTFIGDYAFYTYYNAADYSKNTTIKISDGTFDGALYLYNGNVGSSAYPMDVTITGGTYLGGAYVYTYDSEQNFAPIKCISGGDFVYDPIDYIAKGYARCTSETEDCVYSVKALENEDVQIAPVAPKVDVPEELDEETKTEIETNAYKATIDGIDEVVNKAANEVTTTETAGKEALREADIEVAEDAAVNIFVQPLLDVQITDVDTENGTIALDIKAMVQTYATTAETVYDMVIGNAVAVGEPEELDTENIEVTITIPVPESIIGEAEELMVKHITGGEVYYYPTRENREDNTITFTNPHGFSDFIVSAADDREIEVKYTSNGRPVKGTNSANIPNSTPYEIYDIGVKEIELPTARKSGYNFKGWKLGGENTPHKSDTVVLTQDLWDEAVENDGILTAEAVFVKAKDNAGGLGGAGGEVVTSYTVSFNTNGGSQIESIKVFKGNKVSYPVTPVKDGATFEGWYTDKDCTNRYDFNQTVYSSFTLYAKWISESETIFADVTEGDWFFDVVNEAYKKGLMNGMDEENFGPQLEINRAMFVTVLHRIDGNTEAKAPITFTDVPVGAYYEKAVAWAVSSGIVEGYGDGIFGSTDPITREQMAVMLYRFAQYKGVNNSGTGEAFSDADSIADWAKTAVDWATGAGILNGMGDGTYAPKSTATRAQGAAVFVRIEDLVK